MNSLVFELDRMHLDEGERMSEDRIDNSSRTVRETVAQYVVNEDGQRLAVLLPIEEYERYLDLLAEKAAGEAAESPTVSVVEAEDKPAGFVYPTRLVPAEKLDSLTGLISVGGDALADSEALYDQDRH
jgi:hypothetical protein